MKDIKKLSTCPNCGSHEEPYVFVIGEAEPTKICPKCGAVYRETINVTLPLKYGK